MCKRHPLSRTAFIRCHKRTRESRAGRGGSLNFPKGLWRSREADEEAGDVATLRESIIAGIHASLTAKRSHASSPPPQKKKNERITSVSREIFSSIDADEDAAVSHRGTSNGKEQKMSREKNRCISRRDNMHESSFRPMKNHGTTNTRLGTAVFPRWRLY